MKGYQIPEIALGFLATVAVFAVGFVVASSLYRPPSQENLADWAIVVLTIVLAVSTYGQWRAATRSADTASRVFADMERPYLYVLDVRNIAHEDHYEDPYDYITYSVGNFGKTPAKVESIWVGCNVGPSPGGLREITGWHDLLVSPILAANERRRDLRAFLPSEVATQQYADEDTPPDDSQMEPLLNDDEQFYFWVQIKYHGPFSGPHETNARWRWDAKSARLIKHGRDTYK
jgi:hypothetical protein